MAKPLNARVLDALGKKIPIFLIESCPVCESQDNRSVVSVRYWRKFHRGVFKILTVGHADESIADENVRWVRFDVTCLSCGEIESTELTSEDILSSGDLIDTLDVREEIALCEVFLKNQGCFMTIVPELLLM